MGACTRHVRLYLWKNALQKRRHPCTLCCELVCPLVIFALLAYMYGQASLSVFQTEVYDVVPTQPLGMMAQGYSQSRRLEAMRSGDAAAAAAAGGDMDDDGPSGHYTRVGVIAPPACTVSSQMMLGHQKLAVISSDKTLRSSFLDNMDAMYPGGNFSQMLNDPTYTFMDTPKFSDVVRIFDSDSEVEAHITADDYGVPGTPHAERIWAGIRLISGAPHWEYALRFNQSTVPDTAEMSDDLQVVASSDNMYAYFYAASNDPGDFYTTMPSFVQLQLAIDKMIINAQTDPTDLGSIEADATLALGFALEIFGQYGPTPSINDLMGIAVELQAGYARSVMYAPQAVTANMFPMRGFELNGFYAVAVVFLPFMVLLAFIVPVICLIRGIVVEKETKAREGMRMMGMTDLALFSSWYITYGTIFFVVSVGITGIGMTGLFANSNPLLIFLYFFLFGMSSVAFCFLISTVFNRAKTAAIIGAIIYVSAFFPFFAVHNSVATFSTKTLTSLFSPAAYALALDVLATYEQHKRGIDFTNLFHDQNHYNFGTGLVMMFVDTLLYTVLGWYFDNVIPHEFGQRRAWNFPCTRTYWFGAAPAATSAASRGSRGAGLDAPLLDPAAGGGADEKASASSGAELLSEPTGAHIEPVAAALRSLESQNKVVKVKGLHKVFDTPDGPMTAVDDLSFNMYEGQIFALLGHNGAGKTTTISMLTGLVEASGGSATMAGMDVATQMDAIRGSLGVCPQHDVLFADLTVHEHLQYFAGLKGVDAQRVEAAVAVAIADVGLTEKRDAQASSLSGGQKRKLSVAIALIGDSKIVFLDEPTSGMDPYSRRSTWNTLQNARKGRIICLTTHFMEEADLLGDRIAIMGHGKLRCLGSSNFLKTQYGVGYSLTFVLEDDADPDPITERVRGRVDEARVLTQVGSELSFQLPFESSSALPDLFNELDAAKGTLRFESYGISVTTLEEVFLKVAKEGNKQEQSLIRQASASHKRETLRRASSADEATFNAAGVGAGGGGGGGGAGAGRIASMDVASGKNALGRHDSDAYTSHKRARSLLCAHLHALFMKRVRYASRDRKALCFQLLIPVAALFLGLYLLKSSIVVDMADLRLSPDVYNVDPGGGRYDPPDLVPYNHTALTQDLLSHVPAATATFAPVADVYTFLQYDVVSVYPVPSTDPDRTLRAMGDYLLHTMDDHRASKYAAYVVDSDASYKRAAHADRAHSNGGDISIGAAHGATSATSASTDAAEVSSKVDSTTTTTTTSKDAGASSDYVHIAYTLLQNSTADHAVPTYLNMLHDAMLRWAGTRDGSSAGSITAHSHPLPLTGAEVARLSKTNAIFATLLIVLAFAFIPASFAIFVVKEREVSAKHQQMISGVSLFAYWMTSYVFDVVGYLLPCALSITLIYEFGIDQLTGTSEAFEATVLTFLLYGSSVASFTYLLSYAFKSHSTAQNTVLFLQFMNLIMLIAAFAMQQISEGTCNTNSVLVNIYRLFPGYLLGDALMNLSLRQVLPFIKTPCAIIKWRENPVGPPPVPFNPETEHWGPMDPHVAGDDIWYMLVLTAVYLVLVLLVEIGLTFPRLRSTDFLFTNPVDAPAAVDSDVAQEEARVRGGRAEGDVIVIDQLRKVYGGKKVAVRGLSLGIPRGECFGYLGVNGAGKTSTVKMLTGDVMPTSGTARLDGLDILTEQMAVRERLGYCPQFDALLELLTVREHLELFARIKGVARSDLDRVVNQKIDEMQLTAYANKQAGRLSGGNKRKLSVAIAMIGDPPLMFLDEPSTGMDPVARRFMWDVIARISRKASVILVTHSMQECEALCTRVGIMVGGRLRCLGSPQHLKSKFGKGYFVQVTCKNPDEKALEACMAALGGFVVGGRIFRQQVGEACNKLGDPARAQQIHAGGSGWAVDSAVQRDGSVEATAFAEWWEAETHAVQLHRFMTETFPGCFLTERHESTFTYKVEELHMPLGAVFAAVEARKAELSIGHYSLSQTSLEAIFNGFASQQEEETAAVRGVVNVQVAAGAAVGAAGVPGAAAAAFAAPGIESRV